MRSNYAKTCMKGGLAWALVAAGSASCEEAPPDAAVQTTPVVQQASPRGEAIAQEASDPDLAPIRRQLEEQGRQLEAQQRTIEAEEKKLQAQKRALKETRRQLDALLARAGVAPAKPAAEKTAQAQSATQPVGQAPEPKDGAPPEIAPIFEQPSVLTARGKLVLEPSLQYAYSSNDRVSLVGYTIIPALVIGLIDVQHVNRQTFIGAITARYGLSRRLEVEAKLPYVYRNDDTVTRPLATGATMDSAFNATGHAIGDIELAARYQLNEPDAEGPYYVGGLRFKTRTGKDPFQVSYVPGSTEGITSIPETLPTGSGFYGIQPSLSVIYPSDPAVFFGSINYMWNIKRDVNTDILKRHIGTVDPGDAAGFNFGMGLALNEKASFSLGYEHTWVGKSKIEGEAPPGSTTIQLASLLMGYSYRVNNKTSASLTLGAGLTRDTPDVQLTLRVPFDWR
ncbi:MAG: hypothetical protein PHX38_12600 [Sulfuricella sp.]|nr:hypothetical protein [Sulfuricella sp.]